MPLRFHSLRRNAMHMTDYLAQLYMVAKASQEESGKQAGEGIEIVRNEPFDEKSQVNKYNMPNGQYTYVSPPFRLCMVCSMRYIPPDNSCC